MWSPSLDHRPIAIQWAAGDADLIVIAMSYDSSAASPSLSVTINGVGTFEVSDDRKKIGGLGAGSVHIPEDGHVTADMLKKLYAWSFIPKMTSGTSVEGYPLTGVANMIIVNWSLVKQALGLSSPSISATADASPTPHEFPFPTTYNIWLLGDVVENPGGGTLNVYYNGGIGTVTDSMYIGPPQPTFSDFDEAKAYADADPTVRAVVWADPPPPIIIYDGYSFGFSVNAILKAYDIRVTDNGGSYGINYSTHSNENSYGDSTGANSKSQEDESVAHWDVDVNIAANLLSGNLSISPDPEDEGED
jgi:hypothetical protein